MAHIITRPKIEISEKLLNEVAHLTSLESQVIIHCLYHSITGGDAIRIWPTTYLFDHQSDHVSSLVHAEKISMYPVWTWARVGDNLFTLIFSGLPKACKSFDLIEDCNGSSGSFRVTNIKRTLEDVYYIQL